MGAAIQGKPLRIFVSSPGDVLAERGRAILVFEKLKKQYGGVSSIEPYFWEYEPMLANGHFQDWIELPSRCDIVVLILWSRLGTPLPERTLVREYRGIDGRSPVTGTEWEFEEALAAARARGAPDLLVYRKVAEIKVSLTDRAKRDQADRQWQAFAAFWQRHFEDRGEFRAAFKTFDDISQFEELIEQDLRRLVEKRIVERRRKEGVEGLDELRWFGNPFQGLNAYTFQHAPVFFGRQEVSARAVEQLLGNAEAGRSFLLVLGASGSGKSSLAQAGVVPALVCHGVVPGIGLWRRAVCRPGGHDDGPIAGLAQALTREPTGLPELLSGGMTVYELVNHLRGASKEPAMPFKTALGLAASTARARNEILQHEAARLVLVIDQFEELYTDTSVTAAERTAFVECIGGLACSGVVFVVATMRSDHWHLAEKTPLLIDLAKGDGRLDLMEPGAAEITEMIRGPATAAGLTFERHKTTGVALDATLGEDASGKLGCLPLLSFLLDALYREDVEKGDGHQLTWATYEELGRLKGAIARRAEEVLAAQPAEVQAALPVALRALVTITQLGSEPTVRSVPLETFPQGTPARRLVEALLDPNVRLLVAEGDAEQTSLRLAHEALLSNWQRGKAQVAQDRRDLETRARIELAASLWQEALARGDKKAARGRLLTGLLLEEARDLGKRWSGELQAHLRDFIDRSYVRERWRTRRSWAIAAGVMLVLAGVAGMATRFALLFDKSRIEAENSARREAEGRQLTQNVLNRTVAAVSAEGIRENADFEPLQLEIFDELMPFYVRLLRDAGSEPDLAIEYADALDRLARLKSSHDSLTSAANEYKLAYDSLTALAERPNLPPNFDAVRERIVLGYGQQLIDLGAAEEAKRVLAPSSQTAAPPSLRRACMEVRLARLVRRSSTARSLLAKIDEPEGASALRERVMKEVPADIDASLDTIECVIGLAELAIVSHQFDAASAMIARSKELIDKGLTQRPRSLVLRSFETATALTESDFYRTFAVAEVNSFTFDQQDNLFTLGQEALARAKEAWERQRALSPDSRRVAADLAAIHSTAARLNAYEGDLERAVEDMEVWITRMSDILARDPESILLQRRLRDETRVLTEFLGSRRGVASARMVCGRLFGALSDIADHYANTVLIQMAALDAADCYLQHASTAKGVGEQARIPELSTNQIIERAETLWERALAKTAPGGRRLALISWRASYLAQAASFVPEALDWLSALAEDELRRFPDAFRFELLLAGIAVRKANDLITAGREPEAEDLLAACAEQPGRRGALCTAVLKGVEAIAAGTEGTRRLAMLAARRTLPSAGVTEVNIPLGYPYLSESKKRKTVSFIDELPMFDRLVNNMEFPREIFGTEDGRIDIIYESSTGNAIAGAGDGTSKMIYDIDSQYTIAHLGEDEPSIRLLVEKLAKRERFLTAIAESGLNLWNAYRLLDERFEDFLVEGNRVGYLRSGYLFLPRAPDDPSWLTPEVRASMQPYLDIYRSVFGETLVPHTFASEDLLDEVVVIMLTGRNIYNDPMSVYIRLTLRNLVRLKAAINANEKYLPSEFGTVIYQTKGDVPKMYANRAALLLNITEVPRPVGRPR